MPLFFAVIILFARGQRAFKFILRLAALAIITVSVLSVVFHYSDVYVLSFSVYPIFRYVLLGVMLLVLLYIIYTGIKSRSLLVSAIALLQLGLIGWLEFLSGHTATTYNYIYFDRLTLIMIVIVGLVGSLICLYSEGYMKEYHQRHPDMKDRRSRFYSIMLVSISAMFGLVIFNDLLFMLLFLQVTTLCASVLSRAQGFKTGYSKSTTLTISAFGDLCFGVGIALVAVSESVLELSSLILLDGSPLVMSAVLLMVVGGLIKSAQLPFSKWLLDTVDMPTPVLALLHSVTIVKAGIYVIIRLTPMLGDNAVGISVVFIGGLTFLIGAALAGSQGDARKVLAYSTISGMGLIVACAGFNTPGTQWAAIMLIILHSVAKPLLFLSFGTAGHQPCGRDVEQMEGLHELPIGLKLLLITGMAGMLFAPFVMLISQWTVMQVLIESGNILIVMVITFGSVITLFFCAKWIGKLVAHAHQREAKLYIGFDERVSLFIMAALVMVVSLLYPVVSEIVVVPFIRESMMVDYYVYVHPGEISAIVLMLGMLLVVPVIHIPYFRKHRAMETSTYLAGANTGDDLTYKGALGETRKYELRNRYMVTFLSEGKFLMIGCVICAAVIIGGFLFTMGGRII